jgi:uncharacterized phiE125 gp8 family phage protein
MNPQTTVTAKSSDLPVTLAEAKTHLRLLSDDLDTEVVALLEAATEYCESVCGRSLRVSQTLTQKYDGWPCSPVRFDRQPVTAITSVTYYDADDASQTVSSSNYRLLASSEAAALLEFDSDFTRPTLSDRADAVTVTYTAGYASIEAVPQRARQAIKLLIGHWFNHGEAVNIGNITTEVPMSTGALLQSLEWGCYR